MKDMTKGAARVKRQTAQDLDEPPEQQPDDALDFLYAALGKGARVQLLTIPEDGGAPKGAMFTLGKDDDRIAAWIERAHRDRLNCYLSTARLNRDMTKKPKKGDIAAARVIHADIDPPKSVGEQHDGNSDHVAWREATIDGLLKMKPTPIVVDSGGGVWAFWPLKEGEKVEDVERLNQHLERAFMDEVDGTWNLDRIARLPGTVNWPDKKKRAKGRVPRLAEFVGPSDDELDAIEAQTVAEIAAGLGVDLTAELNGTIQNQATRVGKRKAKSASGKADGDDNVRLLIGKPMKSADDLGELPDYLADLIEDGPEAGEDRSKEVFRIACDLLRLGIEPSRIATALVSPRLGISGHCLDQENPERAAERAVKRAQAAVDDDDDQSVFVSLESGVEWLNKRWFQIKIGGRVRYVDETQDDFEFSTHQAFKELMGHLRFRPKDGKPNETRSLAQTWLNDSRRRRYDHGFILDPNTVGHSKRCYNLWQGYGVEPVEGDATPFKKHLGRMSNKRAADYAWKWFCWTIQNPAEKARVALVLRGDEGTGKGTIFKVLMRLFGRHAMTVSNPEHVVGKFNAHLRDKVFVFADEARFVGEKADAALKVLITEPDIPIEHKGVDVKSCPNHLTFGMATNLSWAVPASANARRYVVDDMPPFGSLEEQVAYFKKLYHWLENEDGYGKILAAALAEDLGDFHPEKDRVSTAALEDQKAHSLKGWERNLFDLLAKGVQYDLGWSIEEMNEGVPSHLQATAHHIGRELKRMGWTKDRRGAGVRVWLPPARLSEARENAFPGFDWADDQTEWET